MRQQTKDSTQTAAKPNFSSFKQIIKFWKLIMFENTDLSKETETDSKKDTLRISEAVVRRCSVKKVSLKVLQNSQEDTYLKKSFWHDACNFIKKRLQHRCFLVNFTKFVRTPILQNIWKRLLLEFFCRNIMKKLYIIIKFNESVF